MQVECIAEFLQALKLERVYLVGHSLGGWIAASYALKYPEQVQKLVLLAPEGVKIPGQEAYWRKMQNLVKRSPLFFRILRSLRFLTKILRLDEKIEQDWQTRQKILQFPTVCQLLFQRQHPEIEAEFLQNRLHEIEIPVLILQGGKDSTDALTRSEVYSKLIPEVELRMISHAGNDLPQSSVGVVAGDIRDFILGNRE